MSVDSQSPLKSDYLILHAGALGDCVLTLHVAMAMRKAGHTVSMAARSPIAAWAAQRGLIDHFIWLDRLNWLVWGPTAPADSERGGELAEVNIFDRVISFLGGPEEDAATRLKNWFGPGRVIHIDPRPIERTIRDGTHITRQWADEINRQGLSFPFEIPDLKSQISNLECSIRIPDKRPELVTSPSQHIAKSPHLILHSGSGGRAKCCPIEAMDALMHEMLARGWNARWMIGPDEMERDGPQFCKRLERIAPVAFEESIIAAANLVARADLFIGNDAGMTHVAALAGVKTVALFGPTDPRVWHPLGSNCRVIRFPAQGESIEGWICSIMATILAP